MGILYFLIIYRLARIKEKFLIIPYGYFYYKLYQIYDIKQLIVSEKLIKTIYKFNGFRFISAFFRIGLQKKSPN